MPLDRGALDELKLDREAAREAAGRRARPVLITAAVLLAALAAGAGWWLWQPDAVAVRVVGARAGEAAAARTGSVLNASGYVVARRVATVSSKITGQITEVLVEEGVRVDQGEVLARLDERIEAARLELARSRLDTVQSGVGEVEARLEEARLTLDRRRQLLARELASQAEVDEAEAQVKSLAAQLEVARSQVRTAERDVALSERNLEDTVVRAPFDGVVTIKNAQPGEIVSPISAGGGFTRTGIATIVDMASLEIEVDVNEAFINRVSEGQPVEAVLDAYPEWRIPARVISIVPTADRQKASVKVRIAFRELDRRILPEMGVQVWFLEEPEATPPAEKRPAAWIPEQALRREDGEHYVFIVERGTARRRAVEAGLSRGGEVQVLAGLGAGARVVVQADAELADGAAVRVRGPDR